MCRQARVVRLRSITREINKCNRWAYKQTTQDMVCINLEMRGVSAGAYTSLKVASSTTLGRYLYASPGVSPVVCTHENLRTWPDSVDQQAPNGGDRPAHVIMIT
eukprot:scaffold59047_cov26-Tisochrysis_lutea.AAC.2